MPGTPPLTSVFRLYRTGDVDKVAKRNRRPVSCHTCRARKLKCDRKQPCRSCIDRGNGETCAFDASCAVKPRQEIELRLQQLEQTVREIPTNTTLLDVTRTSTSNSTPSRGGATASDFDVSPAASTVAPLAGTATAYCGATHWVASLDHIYEVRHALHSEKSPEMTPPTSQTPQSVLCSASLLQTGRAPPSHAITIEEVTRSFPSRDDTDKLLSIYFRSKFTAVPFIHVNQFQREYAAFWADPASTSFLWISILFSIIHIASIIAKFKGYEHMMSLPLRDPSFYIEKAEQCLVAGQYLLDGEYAVEALLIHAMGRNTASKDTNHVLWTVFGLVTRLAQRAGYHRDPNYLPRHISPFKAEMRRRVWFYVQAYDVLLSFQQGMPTTIHEAATDTDHPGNYEDDDFDEETLEMPPPRPLTDATPMLYCCNKSKLCRLLRKVVHHALSTQRPLYSNTLVLNEEIQQWKKDLPPCLRVRPIRTTSFSDNNYTIMHRTMLELAYRKTLCVLHRPYLTYGKDNREYDVSRAICVESALRMLDLHAEFDREIKPGGRLYEDQHMESSLALHDFMTAAMVICLDLNESRGDPLDREKKLDVLRAARDIWDTRAETSRDARRASIVLSAMLQRLTRQTPPATPARELPVEAPDQSGCEADKGSPGFQWNGTPAGHESSLANIPTYVTGTNASTAILIIHDLFGWTFPNLRLLADAYAAEVNATVYLPDFLGGETMPIELMLENRWAEIDMAGILERNSRQIREPEIFAFARALREKHAKVAAVGFCYGGWGVFRLAAREHEPPLVDCVVAGHPSRLTEADIDGAGVPIQILAPERDHVYTAELKAYTFQKLQAGGVVFDYQHFPGVGHGCLVRGDEKDPAGKKAMVRGKNAAVSWMKQHLH
ncbi:uncharacterized protein DNG_04481 [Cephalotrichum gorgonifer]|uniref:Zn(2)-C6 fungal-type domain-containing protein n=1 Tax=Cephalotrichum gorgonifer TaxID=2041049 RepID=A0AAE8MYL8_9PEZI|nr:uncharacterized protein DNG_04481 [Cephalotrichum gorgonifer]